MNRLHPFFFGCVVMALAATISLAMAQQPEARAPAQPNTAMPSPDTVFAAWDVDHNNALSPDEFKAGWAKVSQAMMLRTLKAQFDRNDRNRSGAIDPAEYATLDLVRQAGTSAPPATKFDADKSGSLNFKEYVAMVAALAQRQAASKQ